MNLTVNPNPTVVIEAWTLLLPSQRYDVVQQMIRLMDNDDAIAKVREAHRQIAIADGA